MSVSSIFGHIAPHTMWADHLYSLIRFIEKHGRLPRRDDAATFSDHLYRLRVDGSLLDPLRQLVSDKEYVKLYASGIVGRRHVTETLKVLRSEIEIEAFTPPRLPFVIKPTHLSGRISIHAKCSQKIDKGMMRKWLHTNHYFRTREQNYRYLTPKIIVEEFVSIDGTRIPDDYKIFCFYGTPRFIQIDIDRFGEHRQDFYDTQWNRLNITYKEASSPTSQKAPTSLAKMLDIATRLSRPFSFVRVDLYSIGNEIKVGELTNCPLGGAYQFEPPEADRAIGQMFDPNDDTSLSSFSNGT